MYETRDDVAVVDHVLTEVCGTGAVKSCTADLSPPGMMKSPHVAGNKATNNPAGIPIETPSGMSAAVVAEGLKITAEKQKSTIPKCIGAD